MIKLIIFDVDNTLATPNMPINIDIVNALKGFESQGVRIEPTHKQSTALFYKVLQALYLK
jgi:hydroxymethylpyrimidine pyrophosphatase-like HAD family hydrolase